MVVLNKVIESIKETILLLQQHHPNGIRNLVLPKTAIQVERIIGLVIRIRIITIIPQRAPTCLICLSETCAATIVQGSTGSIVC